MKGLLLRLSALDADAENAVRVISFFDGLIAAKVSPQALVQETARLAECPAGLTDPATGLTFRADPTPQPPTLDPTPRNELRDDPRDDPRNELRDDPRNELRDDPRDELRGDLRDDLRGDPRDELRDDLRGDLRGDPRDDPCDDTRDDLCDDLGGVPSDVLGGDPCEVPGGVPRGGAGGGGGFVGGVVREIVGAGCVWLGRSEALPLDELVLERFAIAARLLLEAAPREGSRGLVELVLSEDAGELERCRALRLLNVEPAERLHVLAVEGAIPDGLGGIGAHPASLGRVHVVLVRALPESFPRGLRVGVGAALPAVEAPVSLRQARTALRFAGMGSDVVRYDGLGALAVIAARMRDEDIAAVPDVAALDALAAEPNGAGTLAVLAAFCATGSARRAAARVHRHHSTIAARLAYAEARLGFSFAAPGERRRLDLAVLLRHLRDRPE